MAVLQLERWNEVIEDRLKLGSELGLEKKFVKEIYDILHNYAIKVQAEIINEGAKADKD